MTSTEMPAGHITTTVLLGHAIRTLHDHPTPDGTSDAPEVLQPYPRGVLGVRQLPVHGTRAG